MTVRVSDLDKGIKRILKDIILEGLFKKYRSLPLSDEADKILTVIDSITDKLIGEVKSYYAEFAERENIVVDISREEYLDIYFNRI